MSLVGVGDFVAVGLTVEQFQQKVINLSSERLVKPVVTVILKEFEKPHIFVEGEVNTPGRIEFRSRMSITDAIAMAGGFKNSSKQSQVLLLRRIDGEHASTRVIELKNWLRIIAWKRLSRCRPGTWSTSRKTH